jgi:hypothetical protein
MSDKRRPDNGNAGSRGLVPPLAEARPRRRLMRDIGEAAQADDNLAQGTPTRMAMPAQVTGSRCYAIASGLLRFCGAVTNDPTARW